MKKTNKPNNTRLIYLSLIVILFAVFVQIIPKNNRSNQNNQANGINRQNCLSDDCLLVSDLTYPVGELPQSVRDALDEAINDEYKAYSTYESIIKKFGNIRPFSMIIRAEEQHISMLKSVYDKYGLNIPKNNSSKITVPLTIQQSCQAGVDAEIANVALYQDKLLPVVSQYPDITLVFQNLMNASQQKHLPAFERCN